jgi:hypothetical protein
MAGKSPVTATTHQMTALKVMAEGADRAEADRARAILLRLDRFGPKPGMPIKPVVIVLDNGPIRKATLAAFAERAHWLIVEWLPKYAPELNDIEIVWGDL